MKRLLAFNIHLLLLVIIFPVISCKNNENQQGRVQKSSETNTWQVIGPGGGGGVLKPTVSPFNGNFVFTHCDMSAAYVSHNGGLNWKMKNLWNVPDDFEFDPVDSNTVYVATRGFLHSEDRGSGISLLLRSADKGDKWQIVYPDVTKSKRVERLQSTDLKPSDIIEGSLDGTIQKVKVDPADNKCIYLGIAPLIDYMGRGNKDKNSEGASLVLSTDHGTTWNTIAGLPGKRVMGIFPESREGYLTVFTEQNCVHVNVTTGEVNSLPLPAEGVIAVEGGKNMSGHLIYLQARFRKDGKGGMYISKDLGRSWKQINSGLLDDLEKDMVPDFRQGLAVCESVPEVAYISIDKPRHNAKGTFDPIYCVYKTGNGGLSWEPVLVSSSFEGYITKNFEGSWMEKSYDPGWGGSPIDMGVAPGNPDICYAGDNGRGYKTTNGGKTWVQIYSHNNPDGSYSSNGLDVTTCYGIHFDPFDKSHFFISYTDIGLFHTFSGGKSWLHSISNIPGSWQNTCYDIEFDPSVKGKVWSVWANAHDLPRDKMFGDRGFGNFEGGVAVSEDAGITWQKSNTGIPENSVCTNVLLDPTSPAGSRILYVSIFEKGVYKSTDGGRTWNQSNNGLGNNLFAWQLRQNSKGRLFVLFARGKSQGKVVDGAVYYSDDQAVSWNQLPLPEGVNGPHDLLIDPKHPKTIFISCWPRTKNGNDIKGGIIKTTDGGKSWKQVFDERVRVNSAGLDPNHPNVIYINTFQNSAYRSEDSGTTWKRIEGYRFKWGQRAIPDINNPGMLFITTYGGSVFYGPAEGVPGWPDDILNMPEGWW
jgi:photosystem II stability/assembly factor-like uncharacterized protein